MLRVRLEAQGSGRELALAGPRCMIGKDAGCDIVIPGWKVSRRHAELFVASDRVYIRDLDSTFGTFINDERVSGATVVEVGDQVRIGSHDLAVAWSGQGQPETEPGALAPAAVAATPAAPSAAHAPAAKSTEHPAPPVDVTYRYRRLLHERLLEAFDVRRTDTHRMADADLRELTERLIGELMVKLGDELPEGLDRHMLLEQVRDEAIGLGPLEPLLADPSITEVMVNRCDEVFVERAGQLQRWPVNFTSDRAVQGIIERIVAPIGRRIDESSPMVDARLKDGSRVNAVIPPLALKGPSITIRKFSKRKLDSSDLLKFGSASPAMIEFLRVCVVHQKNMLISGGTGSGKTTLLNILSNFIPDDERIVTIEDAAELQLHHSNVVSLEARPANVEGKGAVPIRELVKNSLRMRPDRIVVGECRGGEALDMLQAMNTGHDGSLTTAHANSPRDMLARLEVMVLMAGMDLPVTAIREQIASAVDIVVQQTRFACGTRKVTSITEITGVESGKIQLQEVFAFVQTGRDTNNKTVGNFVGRGAVPEFYEELAAVGVPLEMSIFDDVLASGKRA
ncbi:MAG: Flp pilus assembly complex ATPase component TadA [Burkholderiales bacterium]|jgi:pilus assembly protein CpaF|nr:Flp pilus assembly complex ATPase component TadA [Burkholderiales bacterium]